ncbi:MAG: ogr/Delta-like zinc finger family protein [Victivallaceae bacterium]|nr:ogr/Delta-like zinc finger family protein [Victivallaceae bacterium]
MRVTCPHCGARAIVTHRKPINVRASEIYAVCTSEECAARFVLRLSYQYDVTPPVSLLTDSLYERIANLPPADRARIIAAFAPKAQLPLL